MKTATIAVAAVALVSSVSAAAIKNTKASTSYHVQVSNSSTGVTDETIEAALANTHSGKFRKGKCTADKVTVRKEWRNMTTKERKEFTDAENCLMNMISASTGLDGTTNRFSDLQAVHRALTNTTNGDIIHHVGQFLPWHRYFTHTHEYVLRHDCGFTGSMPWWDERKDADSGNFYQSEMWTGELGIGGNGTGPNNCVVDGPFANFTEHIGPLLENTDYCMDRAWDNDEGVSTGNSQILDVCFDTDDYITFQSCIANNPHHGAHTSVGGIMADIDSSPGDPAFFLHHNYIDRLWWMWQAANPEKRMFQVNGHSVNESYAPKPATGWVNTTLTTQLSVFNILPIITVEEVMNIQNGELLCYTYDY